MLVFEGRPLQRPCRGRTKMVARDALKLPRARTSPREGDSLAFYSNSARSGAVDLFSTLQVLPTMSLAPRMHLFGMTTMLLFSLASRACPLVGCSADCPSYRHIDIGANLTGICRGALQRLPSLAPRLTALSPCRWHVQRHVQRQVLPHRRPGQGA